jgi:predicted PurR-regulated permease PerM
MEERNIQISAKTILKVIGILGALYLLFLVREILLALFVSVIIASIIEPFAAYFEKKHLSRLAAAVLVYIVVFGLIGFAFAVLIPVVLRDVPQVAAQLHDYIQNISQTSNLPFLHNISSTVLFPATEFQTLFSRAQQIFGGLLSFVLVLVFTFYLVIQKDPVRSIIHSVVPDEHLALTLARVQKVRDTLSAWFRGQLFLGIIAGSLVFLVLSILGIKYAAMSGLLSGLLEFFPYIGPSIAAIPALFFAFHQGGPGLFFIVLVFYIILQQVQNHFFAPKVMQKAVGLNPIVSIVAVLIGAQFASILGALIAIPVATAISTILQDVFKKK